MFKRIAFLSALLLMPTAAMAQDQPQEKKHDHAATAAKHTPFPQLLIQKRAELNLTDEQVAKLEAISAKMAEHHNEMAEHHDKMAEHKQQMKTEQAEKKEMKHDGMKHDKSAASMHDELFSIFTPEQLEKVKPLMKEHMAAMCAGEGEEQCKMMKMKKQVE
jgi:chromosome segregation ATPase